MGKDKESKRERSRSRDKDRDRRNGEKDRGADRGQKSDGKEGRATEAKDAKEKSSKSATKHGSSRSHGDAKAEGGGAKEVKVAKDKKSRKGSTDRKESKDTKEPKDAKESKDTKGSKDTKESKEAKEGKAGKVDKDGKERKDSKATRDGKEPKPQEGKLPKEAKDKEAKDAARAAEEAARAKERQEADSRQRRAAEALLAEFPEAPAEGESESEPRGRKRPAAAADSDVECAEAVRSPSPSSSSSSSGRRKRRREREANRGSGGFSAGITSEAAMYGPSSLVAIGPVGDKVQSLLTNPNQLAFEVARLKQAAEAASHKRPEPEVRESILKMPKRLQECILDPASRQLLLARTGLDSVRLNSEGCVVLTASSNKGLNKALGQLRRIAYHCQWGCSPAKVVSLLTEKPAGKIVHTMVVRLAATSSRLQSFEARLTQKVKKLRIGAQGLAREAGATTLAIEGVPGLSRKHCTITFEPEKGACYVQDLSTNGTYFNGKRLPRPPYKSPQDARVRVFHGDELFFRLRTDDVEECGYVINLLELS